MPNRNLMVLAVALLSSGAAAQVYDTTLVVGRSPVDLVYDSIDRKIFVVCEGSDNVYIVDPFSRRVTGELPVEDHPRAACWSPVSNKVFVVNSKINSPSGSVTVIDAAGDSVLATVAVGRNPLDIEWCSAHNTVYSMDQGSGKLSVIDAETHEVVASVSTSRGGLRDIVYNSNNDRMYVVSATQRGGYLYVVDCASNEAERLTAGNRPLTVEFCASQNRVFVANYGENRLAVFDCDENEFVAAIRTYQGPSCITWTPPPVDRVWVGCDFGHAVHYMRADGNDWEGRIDLPDERRPVNIAYNPYSMRVYVANDATADVTVLDARTPRIIGHYPTGSGPEPMLRCPETNRMFIGNYWETEPGTITVYQDFLGVAEPAPLQRRALVGTVVPSPAPARSRIVLAGVSVCSGDGEPAAVLVVRDAAGRTVGRHLLSREADFTAPDRPGVYFYSVTEGGRSVSGSFVVR